MPDMDTDMMDIDGDITFDADPIPETEMRQAPQSPGEINNTQSKDRSVSPIPAAYFESLEAPETFRPTPWMLNLQGVSDFGPNDPLAYTLEHCPDSRLKHVRWINDNSVNIVYHSETEAANALLILTHPDAGVAASISPQTPRKALPYSKKPDSELVVREANTGDQKARKAADSSEYYKRNLPRSQGHRQEFSRNRRESPPQILDYGDEGAARNGRSTSYEDATRVGSNTGSYEDGSWHGRGSARGDSRGPRASRRDQVGHNRDVDSYRPPSNRYSQPYPSRPEWDHPANAASDRESRFGRLRDRSASPMFAEEDGRLGFAEDGTANTYYRSRSRGDRRRQRSRSRERDFRPRRSTLETSRWEKDRYSENEARWSKDLLNSQQSTKNHRRTDATDETNKGSLLSRMTTKDGKPLVATRSLASRITRDDDDEDEDASHGRLKGDFSEPREGNFQEPTSTRRDLASRITWVRDGGGDRRSSSKGKEFNIRGTASQTGGFSIRGAAGGE